jgi:hypothetical protein
MGGKYLDVESEARPHSQCPHVCLLFLMSNGSAYHVRQGEIPVVRTVFEGSPCEISRRVTKGGDSKMEKIAGVGFPQRSGVSGCTCSSIS